MIHYRVQNQLTGIELRASKYIRRTVEHLLETIQCPRSNLPELQKVNIFGTFFVFFSRIGLLPFYF